jgi:hypothetical protein
MQECEVVTFANFFKRKRLGAHHSIEEIEHLEKTSLNEEQRILNEGLILSYSENKFIDNISKKLDVSPHFFKKEYGAVIAILDFKIETVDIQSELNLTGYDLVKIETDLNFSKRTARFIHSFQPKYPSKIEIIPQYLYHITPAKNTDKILKIGLTPRNTQTSFKHSTSRIYLLASSNIDKDANKIARYVLHNRLVNREYTVFKISAAKDMSYYKDPALVIGDISTTCFGIFVLRNIPKHLIVDHKTLKV